MDLTDLVLRRTDAAGRTGIALALFVLIILQGSAILDDFKIVNQFSLVPQDVF